MVPKKYATNYRPIGMQRILARLIENTSGDQIQDIFWKEEDIWRPYPRF